MVALVLRIVFRSLVTLFLLTACVFFALHLTGDPARIMLGDGADATALAAFRAQWGLDKPLWEQFLVYLQKFITLDMGTSYLTGLPVKEVFLNAFWPTLDLMIPTAIVTLLFGIPAGVIAALHRNTALDKTMMFVSVFGYAVPNFFMGVLLLLIFSIWLGWLPSYGNATGWHYIMPIITMATSEAAIFFSLRQKRHDRCDAPALRKSRSHEGAAGSAGYLATCSAQCHAFHLDDYGLFLGHFGGRRRDYRKCLLLAWGWQTFGAVCC